MKELEKSITDERTGLKYELAGGYYYPCPEAPEAPKVGRFGMMYHGYLCNHKRVTYSGLMLSGELKEKIEEIDRQAEELFSQPVEQMKRAVAEYAFAAALFPYLLIVIPAVPDANVTSTRYPSAL